MPDFRSALSVHLVETSPVLRERQASLLAMHRPVWHDGLETLPALPWILLANEFFDALPVRQLVRAAGAWHERLVGVEGGRLAFGLSAEPMRAAGLPDAPEGALLELPEAAANLMAFIATRLAVQGGAALAIDYGHLETGFGDTLQAVSAHRFVDPLERPGEADLTCHVDFAALARVAERHGLRIDIITNQATFLEALGIRERAEAIKRSATPAGAAAVEAALARLTDRSERGMGSLFKVLAISRPPV
jgi:SAM-dependent MidA family methyltransferase